MHLYRPSQWNISSQALPPTVKKIAVLDRTKEPGSAGEAALPGRGQRLVEGMNTGLLSSMPRVIGGRYGLGSKDFTPAFVKAVYDG